jgi:hypothetical protein
MNLTQKFRILGHNTRNKYDLHTCYFSTVLYQRSVTNVGIKLFKKLPVQIKKLNNYNGFKREVKIFFSTTYFVQSKNFLHLEGI